MKPPELVRPAAIEDLQAANEADAIVLTWARPTRYVDGARMTDLGEFRIERDSGGEGFLLIATLPVTDQQRFRQIRRFRFADRGVEIGSSYSYRVVSSTVDGYPSAPSNPVAIVREVPPASAPDAPR